VLYLVENWYTSLKLKSSWLTWVHASIGCHDNVTFIKGILHQYVRRRPQWIFIRPYPP